MTSEQPPQPPTEDQAAETPEAQAPAPAPAAAEPAAPPAPTPPPPASGAAPPPPAGPIPPPPPAPPARPTPPPPPPPPAAPPYYYTPPPPQKRSTAWRWGCGCGLAGCLIVIIILVIGVLGLIGTAGGMKGLEVGGDRVALVRVDGIIIAGSGGYSPFGGVASGSDEIVQQIQNAVDDEEAKAILIRVNSPGGSAAASQEIYAAVQSARKRKPVVVSMADVAASGGYYISAPATEIWADPATITGSIGVISEHQDISGLFGKIGVKMETLKAGKFKDMMSPFGPITPEVRALMDKLLSETHQQFIKAVADGRKDKGLTLEGVRKLADGRIYSGQQAKANGLVDELGGMQDALAAAGRLGGIPGRAKAKEVGQPGLLRWLLGNAGPGSRSKVTVTGGLLYDDLAARLAQGALQREIESADR